MLTTTSSSDNLSKSVARQISHYRDLRKLTLAEISAKTKISATYLSRVVNGKSEITVKNLALVAAALDVRPSDLLQENVISSYTLTRKNTGREIKIKGRHSFVALLAHLQKNKIMEPLIVVTPFSHKVSKAIGHEGEEFIYLLRGELSLRLKNEVFSMKEGDSMYFDATLPHSVNSLGKKPSVHLGIIASHGRFFHGDLGKIIEAAM